MKRLFACPRDEQRALLNFEPYPIIVFSLDGRVSYLNPAFTETFGWTQDELEGKRIPFIPPGLEQETREGDQEALRGKGHPVILRPGG